MYHIVDTRSIISPALVVFHDLVESNLRRMVEIAGSAERLRPHVKTHKMPAITEIQVGMGITKHKAATFAEAEMLAMAGASDIFLAYNLVGPNVDRAVEFVRLFPNVRFSATADHPRPLQQLEEAMRLANCSMEVLLDLDSGQHRTGISPGPAAMDLYGKLAASRSLKPGGIHLYDGHNHQRDIEERSRAVLAGWKLASNFRNELLAQGWAVPRIVAGGTGSFPIFAKLDDPAIELSPGTCIFHDFGYRDAFPDMEFTPAALLFTRVISRPTSNRITLDLGYKAVASDPPAGNRLLFPDLPDAQAVLQNEEHLVLETSKANDYQPGDELLAIPKHVCPTSALHKQVYVVQQGKVVGMWDVVARDRRLRV